MKNDGDVSPQLPQTCVQGPFRVPCNQLFCVPIFKWSTRLTIIRYEKHSTLIDHFSILYMVLKTKKGEWSRQFINIQLLQNHVPKLYLDHITAWKIFNCEWACHHSSGFYKILRMIFCLEYALQQKYYIAYLHHSIYTNHLKLLFSMEISIFNHYSHSSLSSLTFMITGNRSWQKHCHLMT